MGVRARNLKNLFADARTRTIIIITSLILLFAIAVGYYVLRERIITTPTKAKLQGPPSIQAIPGAFNPTEQYAKLLEQQNLLQAQQAEKTGKSAIPTIIRVTKPGAGELITTGVQQPWEAGLGFKQLAQIEQNQFTPKDLALQTLRKTSCAPAEIQRARQLGAGVADLIKAGCSPRQLLDAGFTPEELQRGGISACDMLSANGLDPTALKRAGYNAGELKGVGFNACQLKRAGFTPAELRFAGFTPMELRGVGFTPEQIQQAGYTAAELAGAPAAGMFPGGLPSAATIQSLRQGGCTPGAIRLARQAGISAETLRKVLGCTAEELKAGGYNAQDLRNAGYTAAELRNAGFSPEELKNAGYSAGNLLLAGYNPDELKNAGYTPSQIQAGENEARALAGPIGLEELRKRDCTQKGLQQDRADGVSAAVLRQLGCTAAQLKSAGFTAKELKDAGFTAAELKNAGFSLQDLKNAGFTAAQLRNAGYTAAELKNAGFSAADLKNAGFSAQELRNAGFSATDLKNAGFSPQELKDAGFSAADLRAAGFSASDLKNAGYSADDLKNAGFGAGDLKAAGFTAGQLKNAGFSGRDLKAAGFTASDLQNAGFSPSNLREAGFSARELRDIGLSPGQLQDAGFSARDLRDAGFSPDQLAAAGIVPPIGPPVVPSVAGGPAALTPQQEQLQRVLTQQQAQLRQQQLQQLQQQIQSAMATQAGQLFNAWKPVRQAVVQGEIVSVVATRPPTGEEAAAAAAAAAGNTIKAGTIMFGILETAVNSDEPGPVLATIVTGPLKCARLIGSLTTYGIHGGRVMVTFDTMTISVLPQSIKIDAVAIDPNTARTGLSSHTNYHYIEKYGGLFASSFLEGYGQAFLQSGQVVVSTNGNVIAQSPNLTPAGKLYVALGNVGNQFGSQLQDVLDRNPTVSVYSGTSVGILFLNDVTLPPIPTTS